MGDVTEQELGDWFSQCGRVNSAYIKTDTASGQSKCFGFVEFTNPNIADEVIEKMNGSYLAGRNLRVNPSNRKSLSAENHNRPGVFNINKGISLNSVHQMQQKSAATYGHGYNNYNNSQQGSTQIGIIP